MSGQLKLSFDSCSRCGPKDDNEDVVASHMPSETLLESRGAVAVVADGMSGGFGKTAANAAVRGFLSDYYSTPDSWTVRTAGERVLGAINSWIYAQGQQTLDGAHMGCTFSAVVFKSATAHLFHVGDSRVYRLRDGGFECLTHDHRVARSDGRSYLNRAIGIEPQLPIDFREVPLERGDRFLVCTDGIHDFLGEKTIREILSGDLDGAATALVEAALAAEGLDNTSCVIARVDQLGLASPDEYYRSLVELPFPPELEVGMCIDGFRVERELHGSKRSQVYLARDEGSDRQVVLKTPSVNYEDDLEYIEQFALEEWVGRRINNARVLRFCPPDRKLSYLYHVVEHVDGQTLRAWIKAHRRPPIEDVQSIIRQIARGLQAFHRLEMVHRDLKPENVMIDQQGQVKIIDFGSTFIAGLNEVAAPLDRNHLVGTENYTAPEFHAGHVGTAGADVYSLGVIAYEMLTGELPYGDKPPEGTGSCRSRYRPAIYANPMVPGWLDGALEKAVRCNPDDRYSVLSEFVQDFTKPNPVFQRTERPPLVERNPVLLWQMISAVLLAVLIAVLVFCR